MRFLTLALSAAMFSGCATQSSEPAKTVTQPATQPATNNVSANDAPEAVALISRAALFGNPSRTGGTISPNGKWLGFLAPKDGVMNIHVSKAESPDQYKAITSETKRPIRGFFFSYDGQHVLYGQDAGGNEDFHVYATDLNTGVTRDLTPYPGARANISGVSETQPNEVLVSINDRDKSYFDLYRVNISTGKRTLVMKNNQGFGGFLADQNYRVRMGMKPRPDGGSDVLQLSAQGTWSNFTQIDFEDAGTTGPAGLTHDGKTLYFNDSRGRNTQALYAIDLASGAKTLVHEDARADNSGLFTDQKTGQVQAVAVNYLRNEWIAKDPAIAGDLNFLKQQFDEFGIAGQTADQQKWIVIGYASNQAPSYYFYERSTKSLAKWFDVRPELAGAPLQKMHPVVIKARDGLELVSYYTLPRGADPDGDGKANVSVPMVLQVHGGPWARDAYGLNNTHQFWANRGYAVLSTNFRGSTGFGKNFTNAGNLQWSKTMHDDLLDAVKWAEDQGIASSGKTAIAGGSYGGYATLAGLTFTPERFACGVDIVGPSNLNTLLASIPPYWKSGFEQMARRVGDPRTPDGQALLKAASPLTHADKIQRPLLIGQGANDPRVKQAEADQIVGAMKTSKLPVTYVLFPDEGHGFARPENSLAFNAVAEQFLARCLGGRAEPIGSAFAGSSISIPEGAALIEGAQAALKP